MRFKLSDLGLTAPRSTALIKLLIAAVAAAVPPMGSTAADNSTGVSGRLVLIAVGIAPPTGPSTKQHYRERRELQSAADQLSRLADRQSEIRHFRLLGPDWARIPKGYFGVTPEKVVAELNIPQEYLTPPSFFGPKPPTITESIPIEVLFPSMTGAAGIAASDPRRYAVIGGPLDAATEAGHRKGVRTIVLSSGRVRNPKLDVDGLCGYVDRVHPGYAGDEFYTSCDEADQTFSIICFPPINAHHVCNESAFLGGQIGVELFYQYPLLSEHGEMLESLKKLIASFTVSTATK